MKLKFKSLSVLCLTALTMGLGSANAANIKLRVADSLPVGHFFSEYATKYWMEEVTKASDGKITFDYFPAEQLGKAKDLLSLTQSGVADIGYIVPSYVSDKMPLSSVAELPGNATNACESTLTFLKMTQGDGVLAKNEFGPNNVKVIYALVLPPYQLFTGRKAIDSVASISGLKIRTAGGAMDATAQAFDAVPVRMAAPELYESLSRGTVDGMLFPYASMASYDLDTITKYATTGENFGSAVLTYSISESKWNSLPEYAQKIIEEVGIKATERACSMTDADTEKDIQALVGHGVQLVTFEGEDRKLVDEKLTVVNQKWAEDLDKRGRPGTETLNTFRDLLSER